VKVTSPLAGARRFAKQGRAFEATARKLGITSMDKSTPAAAPTRRNIVIGIGAATVATGIFANTFVSGPGRKSVDGDAAQPIPQLGSSFHATGQSIAGAKPVIAPDVSLVRTAGYAAPRDGGSALYRWTRSEPAHPYKFMAADGRWFELARDQKLAPEMFGATKTMTDASAPVKAAVAYAGATDPISQPPGGGTAQGVVLFTEMYPYSTEIDVPAGVAITGARSAGLRRINQVRTTITSPIAQGREPRTFTVTNSAGFQVGQSIMIISGSRIAPVDPFSHRNPQITAINGNSITISTRGAFIEDYPSGSILQTATHGLILAEGVRVEGITMDGNEANQTDASWFAHNEITIEGDNCIVQNVHIKDAPSDGILIGGTLDRRQRDSKVLGCTFTNIGNNGVHFSYMRVGLVANCTFNGTNRRATGVNAVHQDGAVIYSSECSDLTVTGCDFDTCLSGVGSLNSTLTTGPRNENDNVVVTGNTFRRCARPLFVLTETQRIVFTGNRIFSEFPNQWGMNNVTVSASTPAGPRDILIADNQITNGKIVIGAYVQSAAVRGNFIDNSQAMTMNYGAIEVTNSNDVSVSDNTVIGSPYGIHIQNNFGPTLTTCRNIRVTGNQFINQRWIGINAVLYQTATQVDVVASDNSIRNNAAVVGTASYVGIVFAPGLYALANSIALEKGVPFGGTGSENRRGNIVNGTIESG
jgi:parallel beta-helix repeat protein